MTIYKKYRQERGITQQEMAKLLELNIDTYRNYELGRRVMPYNILARFLKLRGKVDDIKLSEILEELYDNCKNECL